MQPMEELKAKFADGLHTIAGKVMMHYKEVKINLIALLLAGAPADSDLLPLAGDLHHHRGLRAVLRLI